MIITENVIKAYLNCKYKSYLTLIAQKGESHKLQEIYEQDNLRYINNYKNYLIKTKKPIKVFDGDCSRNEFENLHGYFFNANFKKNDFALLSSNFRKHFDGGKAIYSSIFITADNTINIKHKILLAYHAFVAQFVLTDMADFGEIIFGENFRTQKILYKKLLPQVEILINEIKNIFENSDQYFSLNKHCKICEYKNVCHEKALKLDHLSLISTIKDMDIKHLNSKGIFTVNQLSYTFRPRRTQKRIKSKTNKHIPALKALALRKVITYIYDREFEFEKVSTKIYLDIEGISDNNYFYYLIGVVIEKEGDIVKKSYWISHQEESKETYNFFLNDLDQYCQEDFILFHYGKYEIAFLNHLQNNVELESQKLFVQKLIDKSRDVLPVFLYKIYCPTFSNDLKSISKHLGFIWTSEIASGLYSIVWRKYWEESNDNKWKDDLIRYNIEDCYALKHLVNFILSIQDEKKREEFKNINMSHDFTEEVQQRYGGKIFGGNTRMLPDYDYINKRAYFDYQRDKVFFRTNKTFKKLKEKAEVKYLENKPDQIVKLNKKQNCIFCGAKKTKVTNQKNGNRTIIDIKITKNGIKRWIIKYIAYNIYCPKCEKYFSPNEYKELGHKYGFNLVSWVIYHYVANNTSFTKIANTLEDFFNIDLGKVGRSRMQRLKEIAAEYYKDAYEKIKSSVDQWHIMHIDETRIRLRTFNGYVWVFTNMETVFFIFRPDRTCDFLSPLLKDFKGVLISDFYKGYDSLDCKQQKCLVHLLRDVNELLFKEQQNGELKLIANSFSALLSPIIATIDKYGLKKRHLNKHNTDVESFYKQISSIKYNSKNGKALFDRFNKARNALFTFLNYDNVPWNNNNAEHSFKHLAIYRRQTNGLHTENRIEDYLILLSLFKTCEFRGINFLKFLLSKERDIDDYQKNYTFQGNKRKIK